MDQSLLDSSVPTLRHFFDAEKINTEERSNIIPLRHYLKTVQSRAAEPEDVANWKQHKKYQSSRETSKLGSSRRRSGGRHSSNGFIEVCLNSDGKDEKPTRYTSLERILPPRLQKSYSTRSEIPSLPPPQIDRSSKSSLRSKFKKKFGSLVNFNPRFEAFGREDTIEENMVHGKEMVSREPPFQKSLLNGLLHTKTKSKKPKSRFVEQDQHEKGVIDSSPVHLRARLKVENRHGMQVVNFILDSPQDVYIAKAGKSVDTHCWVYTFCSANKESSMVAWMQVLYETSLASREFVLYNITHSQECRISSQESLTRSNSFPKFDSRNLNLGSVEEAAKLKTLLKASEHTEFQVSALHPSAGLEMAAIVIQDPAERIKEKGISGKKLKVVIPSGIHGFLDDEKDKHRPSSLLQRWKSGGGCDCGGWDMACPLFILTSSENQELVDDRNLLKLFFEGFQENGSALTMSFIRERNIYEVSFHARLSALQAFAICVAALHKPPKQKRETLPRCDSLKELMDIEAKPADLEKEKKHVRNGFGFVKETSASFMPNVTFSPIAMV